MCLLAIGTRTDAVPMTITADHIYNKTCDKCDRPALTFDRDNHAFCPTHAEKIVRAQPVNGEVPVPARLSGWSAYHAQWQTRLWVVKVERCEHGYIVRHLLSEGWTNPYNDIYNPSIWCNGAGLE
jgi:hypothetical protein